MHAGNGTADILRHFPALYKQIHHHSNGDHWYGMEDPAEWFIWLQECIDSINQFKPDLVLYQAGADMHIKDPLGGLLNDSEMAQRDRSVFRKIRAPIAWNLAGGYRGGEDIFTDPVLQLHRTTLMESNSSVAHRIELLKETR
jgi:acetoin utilization deacetylase AcuC-like enzyme